ncbi:uncharacterized protein [Primulina eburnea]|uniref:uncharacterized protein n=1 Tax=Primulina eburnea TaxID=1245227 RepID=UPI003C6C1CE7
MLDQEGDNLPKPETDWTADKVQNSNYNSKALNAIFTSVDMNMFSLITNCTSAKSAWDALQRHCEVSESVRRTRLRKITSKFEMMRMEESENILDYDRRLREIANEVFSIGDSISNERLVSKVLRSLPERLNIKIYAIDEAKDTSQMALKYLISSLLIFEMNLDMQKKDKGKTIAFQASNDSYNELLQISQEVNDSDLCEDSISFITNTFGDYLERIRDKKKDAQPSKFPSLPAPERSQKYPAKQQSQPRNEGSYNVSLSDEESDAEEKTADEENQTSVTALLTENRGLQVDPLVCLKSTTSGNLSGDDESEADDEEITLESVQKLYEELFEDWTKRNKLNSSLVKENVDLKAVVAKLEHIQADKLDSILLMGRDDKKGLGFKDSVFEIGESSKVTVFVKGKTETFTPSQTTSSTKSSSPKRQPAAPIPRKRKQSGSSRHMTGSREHLIDYVEQNSGRITYGGGAKGKIMGNGTLNVEGLPKLHNAQGLRIIAIK